MESGHCSGMTGAQCCFYVTKHAKVRSLTRHQSEFSAAISPFKHGVNIPRWHHVRIGGESNNRGGTIALVLPQQTEQPPRNHSTSQSNNSMATVRLFLMLNPSPPLRALFPASHGPLSHPSPSAGSHLAPRQPTFACLSDWQVTTPAGERSGRPKREATQSSVVASSG